MKPKFFGKNLDESRIMMRLPLRGKLKIPISKLRLILSQYPGLHSFSYGINASYYLEKGDVLFVFHFLEDAIIHETYSLESPVYLLRESLLRLLGITLFLQEAYEVFPESIFPYIVAELSKQEFNSIPKKIEAARINSEIVLSKRIIETTAEINDLLIKNQKLESAVSLLATHLIIKESQGGSISFNEICSKYAIERKTVDSAIKLFGGLGYKAVPQSVNRFNLVKI